MAKRAARDDRAADGPSPPPAQAPDPETDFWAFYLHEHSKPGTRALHLAGTALALALVVAAALLASPWLLLAALASGYLFAWVGHFTIERNRPATFRYPVQSFLGDWRMSGLWAMGRLGAHLERAGVPRRRPRGGG